MEVLIILTKKSKSLQSETVFQKRVTTDFANILIVSHYEYTKHSESQFEIYCTSSEYSRIFVEGRMFNCLETEKILLDLQKNISKGIFILVTNEAIFMGGSLFDVTFSWIISNEELIVSDSSTDIALFLNLSISKSTLALNLIHSLPYYPFQHISLWEKVNTIQPFCVLKYDLNRTLEELQTWTPPALVNEVESIYQKMRERFLELLSQDTLNYSEISADLSGGVDSAAIIYVLKALQANFKLYHAEADSKWNSDSKWAKLISNDINTHFTSLPSLGSSGRNFKIDMDYANSILPDSPLFWSDTEGYVESIEKATTNPTDTIHYTGLGGDELFTAMPANAWSLVRENKLRSIDFGLQYCLLSRIPISVGIKDLMNNRTFKDAVKYELDKGFGYAKPSRHSSPLNWCGSVTVPNWLTKPYHKLSYEALLKKLDDTVSGLDLDRSRHQIIESLLFQRRLISQLNKIYGDNGMTWQAPFLDVEIINYSLSIPACYRQDSNLTKPILYKSTKGIVSKSIFTRGSKGDYSTSLYKSYKEAAKNYSQEVRNFKLVELGIVDADILISELSMPTALHSRIELFERLVAVERWLRVALKKQKSNQKN